jgi:hypothetical protein
MPVANSRFRRTRGAVESERSVLFGDPLRVAVRVTTQPSALRQQISPVAEVAGT